MKRSEWNTGYAKKKLPRCIICDFTIYPEIHSNLYPEQCIGCLMDRSEFRPTNASTILEWINYQKKMIENRTYDMRRRNESL